MPSNAEHPSCFNSDHMTPGPRGATHQSSRVTGYALVGISRSTNKSDATVVTGLHLTQEQKNDKAAEKKCKGSVAQDTARGN